MSTLYKSKDVSHMPLDDAYFVWLYSQVGSVKNRNRAKTYWSLLRLFHKKEFTWSTIEKDENRAQDGKNLRLTFLRETSAKVDDPAWMDMGCSFLEMLIALADQISFAGGGVRDERFWEMIDNLGLTECTDANPPDELVLDRILNKVIEREYGQNGAGGLFPLECPREDQRYVELWYQANAYLLERL